MEVTKEIDIQKEDQKIQSKQEREKEIKNINKILELYKETKLQADTIYKYCNIYNIDYLFLLSVGILESQLGTDPKAYRARRNNTIFSVGEVDSGVSYRKYKTVHESVQGFCILIHNLYKKNGRTEKDLMRKFTNIYGNRYASSRKYEKILKAIYKRLHNEIKK